MFTNWCVHEQVTSSKKKSFNQWTVHDRSGTIPTSFKFEPQTFGKIKKINIHLHHLVVQLIATAMIWSMNIICYNYGQYWWIKYWGVVTSEVKWRHKTDYFRNVSIDIAPHTMQVLKALQESLWATLHDGCENMQNLDFNFKCWEAVVHE